MNNPRKIPVSDGPRNVPQPCSAAPSAQRAGRLLMGERARRAQQTLEASPDVRVDRVRELKAQIEAGTYRVNVAGLARVLAPLL